MESLRPWRELWILVTLGLAQLFLTGLFQTMVPYAYLSSLAKSDAEIAQGLKTLQALGEEAGTGELTPAQAEDRQRVLVPLFERVPWGGLGILASLMIYPFLGNLAGRYLRRPESAGILILLSAGTGQNPATIPLSLQYTGMGQIALSLPATIGLILFQFVILGLGITWARYKASESE